MKALASISKQMCEAATVCGVDMFKACAYVGDSSAPVFRYYLNLIQGNLQVCEHVLFSCMYVSSAKCASVRYCDEHVRYRTYMCTYPIVESHCRCCMCSFGSSVVS